MGNVIDFNTHHLLQKPRPPAVPAILDYFHCKKCLDELPAGMSPADYQEIEVGGTAKGIQVWCKRHEVNIIHLDFDGRSMMSIP